MDEQLDKSTFLELFNENSPADLQLLDVKEILDTSFNIIQHKKIKEYHYYFSNQGKNHPFCAPLMTGYQNMNIELMKVGAKLFEGTHYFGAYCSKPSKATQLIRTIDLCQIEESNMQSILAGVNIFLLIWQFCIFFHERSNGNIYER